MDWKHILSLQPDGLTDEQKDDLFNTVTWFDVENEEINFAKCKALLKIGQEILKYKGEQVETLLHELDEIAIRQGEEEAKKLESDGEIRSARSRKSSSIELENLEQKYIELKAKHKKILRSNEKNVLENEKLNSKIKHLEQENRQLHKELDMKHQDGSESDISETVKDQQKELVNNIYNKNQQISELLNDIEEVEKDNLMLREKITNLKDELSTATNEMNSITDMLNAKNLLLEEKDENLKSLSAECERLQEEVDEIKKEKTHLEREMAEFTKEVNSRIDEWKTIIEKKNEEIEKLKSGNFSQKPHTPSSSESIDDNIERSHIVALNKTIMEREKQLAEVQAQMAVATKEMTKSTEVLQHLKAENEKQNNRINQTSKLIKELKLQLKNVHERCQKLQEQLTHAEQISSMKEADLNKWIEQLKSNGKIETADILTEIKQLKTANVEQEQKIITLVKTANKLQENSDLYERENFVLREKLGIPEDEVILVETYVEHQKKHTKHLNSLKHKIGQLKEEKIQLKLEIQKLKKVVSSIGNTPLDTTDTILNLELDINKSEKDEKEKLDMDNLGKEMSALSEENEALRKGMHQILNSVNKQKDSSVKEIKSETLEELLRALDVKHISGWYHPAMRLQAELHHVEGINKELREQLREARLEIKSTYTTPRDGCDFPDSIQEAKPENETDENKLFDSVVEKNFKTLNDLKRTFKVLLQEIIKSKENEYLEKEIEILQFKLENLFKVVDTEKIDIERELKDTKEKFEQEKQKYEISEVSLNILKENNSDKQAKRIEEIVTNHVKDRRKVGYLEKEIIILTKNHKYLEEESNKAKIKAIDKIGELSKQNKLLENNIALLKQYQQNTVTSEVFIDVKRNLDCLTIKHRDLITKVKEESDQRILETSILKENQERLDDEKKNLTSKLSDTLSKLHMQNFQNVDDNVAKLSQKLAEKEISEISERQRANHTNNLYELVKEQLKKSEEKFRDFTKYNEDILHKNLLLQEQLKEAEDLICNFVDKSLFNQVQEKNISLLKENEILLKSVTELKTELKKVVEEKSSQKLWSTTKEQELLNLKHQIVDLCSVSDEKLILAQISSENHDLKREKQTMDKQVKNIQSELSKCKQELADSVKKLEINSKNFEEREIDFRAKISLIQGLMAKQKQQYLGCIPLCAEEIFVEKLIALNKEKHEIFLNLQKAKCSENESTMLKEQFELELQNLNKQKQQMNNQDKKEYEKRSKWLQEKKNLQLNELRYKRQCEFKDTQVVHLTERIKIQDEQITKLDEQLLLFYKSFNIGENLESPREEASKPKLESPKRIPEKTFVDASVPSINLSAIVKIMRNVSTQAEENLHNQDQNELRSELSNQISSLKSELIIVQSQSTDKDTVIEQLKLKISELEMTLSMFRKQLGDKQSQITFYEKHILDLQSKKQDNYFNNGAGDSLSNVASHPANELANQEVVAIKATLKALQETLSSKDQDIIKYQTLLKEDRDKHSLAAANLQEELQRIQKILSEEKQRYVNLEQSFVKYKPKISAIEQYVSQVHALEKHTAELHTLNTSLEAQLQSSRQESVRWRSLANDRLEAMEELRKKLEEQHKNELHVYKIDLEKVRDLSNDEINNLRQLMLKNKMETSGRIDEDLKKLVKEKDERIYDLSAKLRQIKNDLKKSDKEKSENFELSPKQDFETMKESLLKENEVLKRRYEQLASKERSLREENRDLKAQLLRKPSTLAKNSKTEKSIKDQLQKKISNLEKEIDTLNQKLSQQTAMNEAHRINASDDFEKWKKQKFWQQNSEKLKAKLKDQEEELIKTQETCAGYRHLIERLEREKITLENRIKSLKSNPTHVINTKEIEMYRIENMKLEAEVDALTQKLEMQQHHSGGLGAAMMQEKLEGQERKIAILELSSKGSNEVRSEIDRLQITVSNLQKTNLCLEAENLDMKMDLEKYTKEVPHLQEQIQHLESYIEILKKENTKQELEKTDVFEPTSSHADTKKAAELERTVFILKRVVEKLQAENKRLVSGKRPLTERSGSAEKLKRDHLRLKEQYTEALQKVSKLESELSIANSKIKYLSTKPDDDKLIALSDELSKVKEQLEQKSHLLEKVKVLLHRAANKEKQLVREIEELRSSNENIPSPILEESEPLSAISE